MTTDAELGEWARDLIAQVFVKIAAEDPEHAAVRIAGLLKPVLRGAIGGDDEVAKIFSGDALHAQLTAERAKVEEAMKAIGYALGSDEPTRWRNGLFVALDRLRRSAEGRT